MSEKTRVMGKSRNIMENALRGLLEGITLVRMIKLNSLT